MQKLLNRVQAVCMEENSITKLYKNTVINNALNHS